MSRLTELNNFHVLGFVDRTNIFIEELRDSQSRNQGEYEPADQRRLQEYLDNLKGYKAWVEEQEALDLPKTNERSYAVPNNPVVVYEEIANLEVRDAIRMFELLRDELIFGSESSRRSNGFAKKDSPRLDAIIDHMQRFLDTYIKPLTPTDTPETATPGVSGTPDA